MQLIQLLQKLSYECICGDILAEVSDVTYNSAKVIKGSLFICIEGANYDGHIYAGEAVAKGASVLVTGKPFPLPEETDGSLTVIRVADTRYAMAHIAAAFYGYPAASLRTIGITGTKGKTTAAYLIRTILEKAGYKTGLIGTIETIIGEKHIPADNTTPESYILQQTLAQMVEEGCQAVVMEVSSQALKLHRTAGILFDYGIFTNLSPDHIGPNEHESFEEYLFCKSLLFRQCRIGIANADDPHMEEVLTGHLCYLETFGIHNPADLMAEDLCMIRENGALGTGFHIKGLLEMNAGVAVPGRFSVYNALAAVAVCRHFEVPVETIQEALFSARVKGRIEPVEVSHEFSLLIDYAHNAASLESLLRALREYEPHRLVCLFGCGGNRSRLRRFEMGETSGRLADITVITSDNPRFEEPAAIMQDIVEGIKRTEGRYREIIDRKEAIAYVLSHAEPGDIVVLAGKGHEIYQEIKGVKYPMDERELIREILEEKAHGRMPEAGFV